MSSTMPDWMRKQQRERNKDHLKQTDRDLILPEFRGLKGGERDRIAKLIGFDRVKTFGDLSQTDKRSRYEAERKKRSADFQANRRNPLGAGVTGVAGDSRYTMLGDFVAKADGSDEFINVASDSEISTFRESLKKSQTENRDAAINTQLRARAIARGGDITDTTSLDGQTEIEQKKKLARLNRKTLLGELIGGAQNGKTLIGQ